MYLSDPVVTLIYDSEKTYIASLEFSTRKIRVFWEDEEEDGEYQCFTVFDATDEDGNWFTLEELVERTNQSVTGHRLEPEDTLNSTHEHATTDYPPE